MLKKNNRPEWLQNLSDKECYDDDPQWQECVKKYVQAEEYLGIKELIFVKHQVFKYPGLLIHLSPARFEMLLSLLRERWKALQ